MSDTRLDEFAQNHRVRTKGSLAAILQLTRMFAINGLPINPDDYRTEMEGQVKGIGSANCQKILAEYHITRRLAKEGGRTSRDIMALMQDYAALINELEPDPQRFKDIERYWVQHILDFFASKPFRLASDPSLSITAAVDDLLAQAKQRQEENPGTMYEGTMLQQLVAAKLSLVMPDVTINGAAAADDPTGRGGDFNVGTTAVHCTTAPATLLMEKCRDNLSQGLRPIIVTIRDRTLIARALATDMGFADRLEIWDIGQFLSANVYEHGYFNGNRNHEVLLALLAKYNEIIDEYEGDTSLRIAI